MTLLVNFLPFCSPVNMNRISQCLFFFMFVSLFLAVLGLRCCAGASHCSGLSCCRAQAPDLLASVVAVRGLTSCSWWTQSCCRAQAPGLLASVVAARGLTICSWWTQSLDAEAVPWASLLCNMCSRPRPGTSLVSSALAGGLPLPVPPGKPSVPS